MGREFLENGGRAEFAHPSGRNFSIRGDAPRRRTTAVTYVFLGSTRQ